MLLTLLAACDVELRGHVSDPDGVGVGGATLHAEACDAVTDAQGDFRTRCPRGVHHFLVEHPAYAASTLRVDATAFFSPEPGRASLRPWPTEPGVYLQPELLPLPATPLVRVVQGDEQRFCLDPAAALPTTGVNPGLFDVHSFDWRLYRLDTAGCALILRTRDGGRYWSPTATVEEAPSTELAPGFRHVHPKLGPGRYVIAAWYDGFLVPVDPKADTWEAWGFEVR